MSGDLRNIDYLKTSNARQQKVFDLLSKHMVMEKLRQFGPVVTGTFPLNIDIPGSDIDIACCWKHPWEFTSVLKREFIVFQGFTLHELKVRNNPSIVCNFILGGYPVEIFGQAVPVEKQDSYRHMMIEHRILQERGEAFRQSIINLKAQGLKTEPAFARMLGLVGDPYEALLALEK